jgi:hypothetical protein
MENILRKVAQFQLIYNDENESYYIINTITREMSYDIDFERVNTLMVLDRLSFSQRCIQSAGNNLDKKIQ